MWKMAEREKELSSIHLRREFLSTDRSSRVVCELNKIAAAVPNSIFKVSILFLWC